MPNRRPTPIPDLEEYYVADAAALQECLTHLRTAAHIGFDTEFVGEETYRPELCLVQISTSERLYLIDPLTCGNLVPFWEVLADPARQVIMHAGREELRQCHFALGHPPAHVFDVQLAAGLCGYSWPMGYGNIVQELLDIRTKKGETLTDWRRRPLSPAQIQYAYDDVRFLLPMWKKLHGKLQRLNREDWAAEEFAVFVKKSVTDDPAVEKWRKLKGLGGLHRKELAVARELYVWRDSVASRQNRPQRTVIRDEILVEVARRGPTTEEDAASMRGLPRGLIAGMLEAVKKAKGLPNNQHPEPIERDNDLPHVQLLATLLNVVLAEWCSRNKLAPNLVATMTDLRGLVRARQPDGSPPEGQLLQGWRQRAVLPELEAFLDGRRSMIVADAANPLPLTVAPLNSPSPE
ncbi:HRDC domain-containing protein [soil metagenome]